MDLLKVPTAVERAMGWFNLVNLSLLVAPDPVRGNPSLHSAVCH